jgi:hypothetical protein
MVVSCVSKGMELLLEWNGAHYTPGNRLRQLKTRLKMWLVSQIIEG